MSVEIGQVLDGKYQITRLIGRGGMGSVYEGLHRLIDRRVAIKVLLPTEDPHAGARFEQEARAAGRIGNDHILEVYDIGTLEDSAKYMVCEYLDGEPFSSRIESRGRLAPEEVAPLMLQLLAGLGAAHEAGIIHRDLKPDNIFLLKEKAGQRDFVKIIDFGISKFAHADGDMSMTKTGTMVGTPHYMSPEQARGVGRLDARVDIYAVGVMLFEAVSGQLPFQAESFNDLLFKVVLEEPIDVTQLVPDVDPGFVAIIKKAMARDPASRYQSAAELALAIDEWAKERHVALGTVVMPQSAAVSAAVEAARRSSHDLGLARATPPTDGRHSPLPAQRTPGTLREPALVNDPFADSPADRALRDSSNAGSTLTGEPAYSDVPRIGSPTPSAFGTTSAGKLKLPEMPLGSPAIWFAAAGSLVVIVVLALVLGGGEDEQPEALVPEQAESPVAAEGPTQPDVPVPADVPEPEPEPPPEKVEEKAEAEVEEKASPKEKEAKPPAPAPAPAPAPRPAPRASPPAVQPRPRPEPSPPPAPAPEPRNTRRNFGY